MHKINVHDEQLVSFTTSKLNAVILHHHHHFEEVIAYSIANMQSITRSNRMTNTCKIYIERESSFRLEAMPDDGLLSTGKGKGEVIYDMIMDIH
jgi:hypothetical protein